MVQLHFTLPTLMMSLFVIGTFADPLATRSRSRRLIRHRRGHGMSNAFQSKDNTTAPEDDSSSSDVFRHSTKESTSHVHTHSHSLDASITLTTSSSPSTAVAATTSVTASTPTIPIISGIEPTNSITLSAPHSEPSIVTTSSGEGSKRIRSRTPTSSSLVPTPITATESEWINAHNAARAVLSVGTLTWYYSALLRSEHILLLMNTPCRNTTLAASAQRWANKCDVNAQRSGENVAAGTGAFSASQAVQLWVNEAGKYRSDWWFAVAWC